MKLTKSQKNVLSLLDAGNEISYSWGLGGNYAAIYTKEQEINKVNLNTLESLEDAGLIKVSHYGASGSRLKYYGITEAGKAALNKTASI